MWGCALIYCQNNLTDGYIPEHAIHSFGVRSKNKDLLAKELCRSLVPGKGPLWHRTSGGYQVHDYLDWNDSKVEILKMRAGSKDRIAQWRKRHASNAEHPESTNGARNALQGGVHPSLQGGEHPVLQHAHDVVRGSGSGDLQKEEDRERRPRAARSTGVLSGALHRDHLKHAVCDSTFSRCVPEAVHAKLLNKLAPKHGGDREAASLALKDWYLEVWSSLTADFVIGEEFRFWQARFDERFSSKISPKYDPKSDPFYNAVNDDKVWDDIVKKGAPK